MGEGLGGEEEIPVLMPPVPACHKDSDCAQENTQSTLIWGFSGAFNKHVCWGEAKACGRGEDLVCEEWADGCWTCLSFYYTPIAFYTITCNDRSN